MMTFRKAALLLLLILTCYVHQLRGDEDNCKADKEQNEKCFSKLKNGLPCDKESDVEECFKKCQKKHTYYENYSKSLAIMKKAICEKKLDKEASEKNNCITAIFRDCQNTYDKKWSDKSQCDAAKASMKDCEKSVEMNKSLEECVQFMKTIHEEITKGCKGLGHAIRSVTGHLFAAVLLLFLFNSQI